MGFSRCPKAEAGAADMAIMSLTTDMVEEHAIPIVFRSYPEH